MSRENAEQGAREEGMEEEEDEPVGDIGNTMKVINSRTSNIVFPLNEDDLDRLEGININFDNEEFQDDLPGTAVDTDEKVIKVVDALVGKGPIWQSYGAGKMVTQIVSKGLRLNFVQKQPSGYREPKDKGFS